MLNKKLLIISLLTILLIAIFHFFSLRYSWYWTYRWLDIPVHIIGGFWVSLTVLWISLKIKHIDNIFGYKKKALLVMLGSVLILGIFWEIFELIFKITSMSNAGYFQDSLSDILSGFFGGIIAFLYFTKNKKVESSVIQKDLTHNFVVIL